MLASGGSYDSMLCEVDAIDARIPHRPRIELPSKRPSGEKVNVCHAPPALIPASFDEGVDKVLLVRISRFTQNQKPEPSPAATSAPNEQRTGAICQSGQILG